MTPDPREDDKNGGGPIGCWPPIEDTAAVDPLPPKWAGADYQRRHPNPDDTAPAGRWATGTDVNPDADVIVHDERVNDRTVLRTVDVTDDPPTGPPARPA